MNKTQLDKTLGTIKNYVDSTSVRRIKKTIDLTNKTTYPENKWFPCTAAIPKEGMRMIEVAVQLDSGSKPSWSTHAAGFSCCMRIETLQAGWGTVTPCAVCTVYTCSFTTDSINPCGYSQMTNASNAVLWLRGGGKYFVYTDWSATWTPYNKSTTISNETIEPKTSCPGISLTKTTLVANLSGNASTATKATQDSAGQQINTTYIKGLSVSGRTITYTKGNGSTATITTQDTTYSTGNASTAGLTKLYTGTGTATDGTMTQGAIKTALDGKASKADALQAWDCTIKCATWSRIFAFDGTTTVGGSFIVNLRGTRGNVVFNVTLLVNFSHSGQCNIVQLNNTNYSNLQVRGVVSSNNGGGYFEVYDTANSATNRTTQTLNISFTRVSNGVTITKYTAFTDGTKIPTNYSEKGKLTTVSGTYYTGVAAKADRITNARTLTIGSKGKTFDGSANVSWTLDEIGAAPKSHTHSYLPLTGGTLSGPVTVSGESIFHNGTYTDPLSGTRCAIKASGNVAVGGTIYEGGTSLSNKYAAVNHGNHVPSQCGTVSNWNDALHNGWYMASGAANQPAGDSNTWYMGQVLCHNTNYVIQILHQFASNGGDSSKTPIFIRKKFNGSWGSWTSNFAINITGSSTGLQTSSFKPMGAGSATQPVYFSNGIPVAGKSYFAKSTVGDIGWEREDSHAPVTVSAIAFWNGAYRGSSSNLAYCNQGAFGNIVTKNQGDYAPASHNHTVLTGEVKINNANGSFNDAWNGQGCALKVGGLMAIGGTTMSSGEYRSYSANAFRAVQGDYGFFIRNDGSHTYFMLTNAGDQYGNWNNFRPIVINNSTGEAIIGGTVDKWNGYRMRTGSGIGGANGYITFSY